MPFWRRSNKPRKLSRMTRAELEQELRKTEPTQVIADSQLSSARSYRQMVEAEITIRRRHWIKRPFIRMGRYLKG